MNAASAIGRRTVAVGSEDTTSPFPHFNTLRAGQVPLDASIPPDVGGHSVASRRPEHPWARSAMAWWRTPGPAEALRTGLQTYLMCIPEIALAITSCWISAVPSKMS